MAKIVNNEFQIIVMNKSEELLESTQKEDKIFCTSKNIVKSIKPHKLLDHVTSLIFIRFDFMITYCYINCFFFFNFDCSIR